MSDPVLDFLKHASARTAVSAYTRTVDGKAVAVSAHSRDAEDAPARPAPSLDDPAERERQLRIRQSGERALWQAWVDGGQQPRDLRPLLKSFGPLIRNRMGIHLGRVKMIPDKAIKAEYQVQFVQALRSYNPEKGSLGTYVYRYLDKAKRFIAEYQNVGRIPENRIYKIREYKNAVASLAEETGAKPSQADLVKKLGWTKADVGRMDQELRNDLVSQNFEEDPFMLLPSRDQEVLRLFKYELEGDDRTVYEYLTGLGRPRITSTGEIAEKVGLPDYRVSRIKNSIKKQLEPFLRKSN